MSILREARERAGLRRDYVARKLNISYDHMGLIERGKSKLDIEKIEALANLYNKSYEEMARVALETFKEGREA